MNFFLKSKILFTFFFLFPSLLRASHIEKVPIAFISADYDGCFDIKFSAIKRYLTAVGVKDPDREEVASLLEKKLKSIEESCEKVHFFNGSSRQSKFDDERNRNASQRRNRFPLTSEEGYLTKDYTKMTKERSWEYDSLTFSSNKRTFISMQLSKTYKKYKDLDHIDFYFFDDRKDILDDLVEYFSSTDNGRLFERITLHLIQYDWFSYFEDPTKPRSELEDYATFPK